MRKKLDIPECPSSFKIMYDLNHISDDYESWRVVKFYKDGTWRFLENREGPDFKSKINAEKLAERENHSATHIYTGRIDENGNPIYEEKEASSWSFPIRYKVHGEIKEDVRNCPG